jgi:IPT/TIG domain
MRRAWGVPLVALFAMLLVGMPAAASNATFTASHAPGADGVATDLHLNAVDCSSPGNCVAVGFQGSSGAVDVETAGKWRAVGESGWSGVGSSNLTSVSCPAPGSCVAVGTGEFGGENQGVIEMQTGNKWKGIQVTGDGGLYTASYQGELSSVSCPAVGSCAAVGQAVHDSMGSPSTDGLVVDLIPSKTPGKPSVWSAKKAPEYLNMKEPASLSSVACSVPGECRAVGYALDDTTDHNQYALVVDEKNYVWFYGAAAVPADSNGGAAGLQSISCIGHTFICMAGGYYSTTKSASAPMIQTIDSKDHSQVNAGLVPNEDTNAELDATSCASNGFCQSVGLAYDSPGDKTYGYGWDGYIVSFKYGAPAGKSAGMIASNTRSPGDANTIQHNENFTGTSCTTQGVCVAVGTYVDTNDVEAGVIDTRTYDSHGTITKETDIRAPEPAHDPSTDYQPLYGVSCTNSSHCAAVGNYSNDSDSGGVIETLGGSSTPPTVSKVSPSHGRLAAGTKVTITGTGLAGAKVVRFGTTEGTKLTVVSASKLTVVTPKEKAGRVDVRVTTAGGTSAATKNDRFTYLSPPSVSGVNPSQGSHHGGDRVTITGKDLSGATKVRFGSVAAGHLTQVSSTKLIVTCPGNAPGTVDVRVWTAGGTSAKQHADEFTYH